MNSQQILIVYGTRYGHTAKIATRIQTVLVGLGFAVTAFNADALPADVDPAAFDGVIVGASVIRGKHQAAVTRFIRRHLATLNRKPSAFFSASGSAGAQLPSARADARRLLDSFLAELQWHPAVVATVAGAIEYSKYSPIMRWIMKRISKREGRATDTSRDYEYTDWAAVDELARSVARAVEPVSVTAPV